LTVSGQLKHHRLSSPTFVGPDERLLILRVVCFLPYLATLSSNMTVRTSFSQVDVRGLPITVCKTADVRDIIATAIEARESCRIATVNLDFLRLADERPEVQQALLDCEHRFADGWPVLELARLAGRELPERVTGADLTPRILSWAREMGWKVGLIGGMPETAAALKQQGNWADVVVGHWLPTYQGTAVADPELAKDIQASGADILLVALGCPKQELWIHANLPASGAVVALGIGGSLEFLAGITRRAPRIFQALRLEFAFRMLMEPRRLGRRYMQDYWFWRRIIREARQTSKQHA
jgi:N-acetylglucosaminyldiphosphoundecaprenol N-acetyl-beta-D-mannosaminyltransferase